MDNQQTNQKISYDLGKALECFLGIIILLPVIINIIFGIEIGWSYNFVGDDGGEGTFLGLLCIGGVLLIRNNITHLIALCKDLNRKRKERKLKKSSLK